MFSTQNPWDRVNVKMKYPLTGNSTLFSAEGSLQLAYGTEDEMTITSYTFPELFFHKTSKTEYTEYAGELSDPHLQPERRWGGIKHAPK